MHSTIAQLLLILMKLIKSPKLMDLLYDNTQFLFYIICQIYNFRFIFLDIMQYYYIYNLIYYIKTIFLE
jgi:hypothetical protein